MTPFLQLAVALAIIIAAAKLGGYLSYRLGQPSVLGELLVGVILGPTVLDILHIAYFTDEHLPEVIDEMAEVGVLLLMFIAGLDLHLDDLLKSGKTAAISGLLGVVLPLILGTAASMFFLDDIQPAIFIGLILSATSVSISAQTLMELGVLRSRVGITLLGAAVFDDILVVLGLSLFVAAVISGGGGVLTIVTILGKMILYLAFAGLLGYWLLPRISQRIDNMPISQGLIAFTVVIVLVYGWAAEQLGGIAAITGAFLAGLLLARSPVKERIENGVSALAYGLFVPIFFIDIGLKTNARELGVDRLWFLVILMIVAVIGKVLGAGLGARITGFTLREALQLGIGMVSRGEVGLIVAAVGIAEGVISQGEFSTIVGVVILTTLITPPMLRASFRKKKGADKADSKPGSAQSSMTPGNPQGGE